MESKDELGYLGTGEVDFKYGSNKDNKPVPLRSAADIDADLKKLRTRLDTLKPL